MFYGVFRGLEWFHDVPDPSGIDSGPGIPGNGGLRVRLCHFLGFLDQFWTFWGGPGGGPLARTSGFQRKRPPEVEDHFPGP